MMKKRTILATAAFLAGTAGMVASTLPASAASVVGNFVVADNGPGCWSGGALLSDGTGTGAGNCSFKTPAGQEILHFAGKTWTGNATVGVTLCATVTAIKDPLGLAPGPLCIGPLPVNVGPVKFTD